MSIPARPKIYHIVHIDNLASIVADGYLWSDSVMTTRQDFTVIGMSEIKQRRLERSVVCHPGTNVGDFVPFYFCPRSCMLYVISQQNHPLLQYRGGQGPIVHLEADLHQVVQWAQVNNRFWAFSTINAAHSAAAFYCALDSLDEINWSAVNAQSWMHCRDEKQAEFLVRESFPWHLIRRIGVHSHSMVQIVRNALGSATHRPNIEVRRDWYYS